MTRINLVHPSVLSDKALAAERHEAPRVFTLARECYWGDEKKRAATMRKQPSDYTLGTGHLLHFYDKIGFIINRVHALNDEAIKRGWNITIIPDEELLAYIPKCWQQGYIPTAQAMAQSVARLKERGQLLVEIA